MSRRDGSTAILAVVLAGLLALVLAVLALADAGAAMAGITYTGGT